jgi:hypothetical protein
MRRLPGVLAVLVAACAGSTGHGGSPATRPVTASVPPPLPAGLYHVAYLSGACAEDPACADAPAPTHAVVLARSDDPVRLAEAARRGGELGLAPGYPIVVAAWELGAGDGVLVIAGLHADAGAAARAAGALGGEVVALPADPVVPSYFEAGAAQPLVPVVIERDAPAYRAEALEALEQRLDESLASRWVPLEKQHQRRRRGAAALPLACRVPAGSIALVPASDVWAFRRMWAPARCPDGSAAWVAWDATRLVTLVVHDERGTRIHQVILVECDVATTWVWSFDAATGRRGERILLPDSGGCGG